MKKEKTEKKEKKEKSGKKRRFPWGLIVLLVLVIAIVAFIMYVNSDEHSEISAYRGTIIKNQYCYYDVSKDDIIIYSMSKGPQRISSEDEQYEEFKAALKPADTSATRSEYSEEVGAAIGESFDASSYYFIDKNDGVVIYTYPSNGKTATWMYNIKRKTVRLLIDDPAVKPIAYSDGIVYARNTSDNITSCYRVSTSYSGELISVMPVKNVTSSQVSFLYTTMIDFAKGLLRGVKASGNTN